MKSWRILLTIFVLIVAQSSLAADYTLRNPFLYRIEKNGKISYLFGSMHAGLPLRAFPGVLDEIYQQARTVAFEQDPVVLDQELAKKLVAQQYLPEGKTFRDVLSAAAVDKLNEIYQPSALTFITRFTPSAILDFLHLTVANLMTTRDGISWKRTDGFDHTMVRRAKADKKSIVYFDRIEDHLEEHFDVQELEDLLRERNPFLTISQCFDFLRQSYVEGTDERIVEAEMKCETRLDREAVERRTGNWIPKLTDLFSNGNALAIVGVAHLVGSKGAIRLLRANGFTITRVDKP